MKQLRIVLSVLCFAVSASSQVSTGSITVQVQDSSGAVVPGATIRVLHVATGQAREGTSTERGEFLAPFMPVGTYSITASAPGFKTKTVGGLELLVDRSLSITAVLQPGEVREVIEVTAATPLLESTTSSLGQVIENRKILELPLNGRNPFALGLLAGNTTPVYGMGTNLPFVGGGGRFSANEVMLDGVDNNTTVNNGSIGRAGIAYTPSVDAVQEFKVKTSVFSAEFGHSAGTIVNATIKSGTNQFHGTLFEFLRNDVLDATNFFTNLAGSPKPKFRQNQFGGALGGRIVRSRTFFFADYQGTRQRTAAGSSVSAVPTSDLRAGDFAKWSSTIFDAASRRVGPAGTVVAIPYPNNRIPSSQLDPASVAVTALVPLPNFGSPGAQTRNFFRPMPRRFNGDQWDVRIDHSLTGANTLFGRFSFGNQVNPSPGRFEGFIGGGSSNDDFTRHFVLSDTHVFSPHMVNEFRFGYTRHNGSIQGNAPKGVEFALRNQIALFPFPLAGFPSLSFIFAGTASGTSQFSGWGGGASNLNIENRFQWADSISITHGAHTLKAGVDFRRPRFEVLKGTAFFGEYIFGSTFTSSSDTPGSGAPFADFLLGYPTRIQGAQMLDWGRHREIHFGGYFQDDWKVNARLTLNIGIRYEIYTQPVDARDRGSLFDLKTGRFQVPGKDGYSRAIVDGDHNNLGPRVGFAYQFSPRIVVRGGYGIFYGLRDQNQEVTQFSGNIPNTPTLSIPSVTAARTVRPPFTIHSPIVAEPTDPTLSEFSADKPVARLVRTQAFHDARFPMLHELNVSTQYEPFSNWLFEVSLSAARGRDLTSAFINQNQVPFEYALDGRNTQRNRPYPHINGNMSTAFSIATSSYHAANFKVEKRYSSGLNFLANYTIQKNIESNGSGPSRFNQSAGSAAALDTYNLWRERGVAPIDVPQIFVVSYGYELPGGAGKHGRQGSLTRLFGGWQLNGVTSLRGGFPQDMATDRIPPVFNTGYNVPDRTVGQPIQVQTNRGVDNFFNPRAFSVPRSVMSKAGTPVPMFGNAGRRVARGPGSVNFDTSLFKEMLLTERYRLQFRAEAFNLTNTPTFFLPDGGSPALTCMGPSGGACDAGNPEFGKLSNGSATGRQIQFGLKLLF